MAFLLRGGELLVQLQVLATKLLAQADELRQQLAAAQQESLRLNDRIDSAKVRLEQLIARLPD